MIEKFIKKKGTQTWILNPEWIKKNYPDTINLIKEEVISDVEEWLNEEGDWRAWDSDYLDRYDKMRYKHLNTLNQNKKNEVSKHG